MRTSVQVGAVTPLVISLPGGRDAARAYAEHTTAQTRDMQSFEQLLDEIAHSRRPVLLSLDDSITSSQLLRVVDVATRAGLAFGLVDAWRGQEAATEHAKRLTSWKSEGTDSATLWADDASLGAFEFDSDELTLRAGTDAGLAGLLTSRSRVVGLTTHGNGIDASAGPDVICGLLDTDAGQGIKLYFPCGQGGPCIRARDDGTGPREPHRVPPSDLPGDVLIWETCYGMLGSDSVFDATGGLLRGLVGASSNRQVITTCGAPSTDTAVLLMACLLTNRGMPLGEVVLQLNQADRAEWSQRNPAGWVLVGDPTASLPVTPGLCLMNDLEDFGSQPVGLVDTGAAREDRIAVARGGEQSDGNRWISFVKNSPYIVWLDRQVTADELSGQRELGVVSEADDTRYAALRTIWGSMAQLSLSNVYFTLASQSTFLTDFSYEAGSSEPIVSMITSLGQAQPMLSSLAGRVWDDQALEDTARTAHSAWAEANQAVFDTLLDVVRAGGGTPDHLYPQISHRRAQGRRLRCRYCGSTLTAERWTTPMLDAERTLARCIQCTTVSDVHSEFGALWLSGPRQVRRGEGVSYAVEFEDVPELGIDVAIGCLTVERTVGESMERGPQHRFTRGDHDSSLELTWDVAHQLPVGVHFVVASVVIDGGIAIARRPISVC